MGERQLGDWNLGEPVGRGAMGTVYRATAADGRIAAVKVLSPQLTDDDLFVGRFQREIEALRQLSHPHIVALLDSGEVAGEKYFAMEFVDGPNYEQRLQTLGKTPWQEVLIVGRQMAEALKHAHDRGVIHRDLKPANVLACGDPDGPNGVNIKLSDFGVAKLFASPPLTSAGGFVGTAAYLAPEQAAGKPPSKRSDFYSLGCVLYALLVGRPPFAGESVTELLHQHRFAQPEQPVRFVPDLPHELNAIIVQLLDKDPLKRPADGSVLIRQFDRIIGKHERKSRSPNDTISDPATDPHDARSTVLFGERSSAPIGPGPATIAAEFVRNELRGNSGLAKLNRVFERPWVVIPLFVICLAAIIYGLWRPQPSAEELLAAARPLMESSRQADWITADREYLRKLEERFPDAAPKAEIAELRQRIDDAHARDKVLALAATAGPPSDAARFYRLGLQQCQSGDVAAARRTWLGVVRAFGPVDAERRWVRLAQEGLLAIDQLGGTDFASVKQSLAAARAFAAIGKTAEANAIWEALEFLYRDNPDAQFIRDAIKRDRGTRNEK